MPQESVYFGEVSLTGAVRQVSQTPARLKEAAKLGFSRAVMPAASTEGLDAPVGVDAVPSLASLVAAIAARAPRKAALPPREASAQED